MVRENAFAKHSRQNECSLRQAYLRKEENQTKIEAAARFPRSEEEDVTHIAIMMKPAILSQPEKISHETRAEPLRLTFLSLRACGPSATGDAKTQPNPHHDSNSISEPKHTKRARTVGGKNCIDHAE